MPQLSSARIRRTRVGEHRDADRSTSAILLLSICLGVAPTALIAPMLTSFQSTFAAVPQATVLVPMLLAIPSVSTAVVSPIIGVFLDYVGRRYFLIGGLMLFAIAGTAPIWLDSLHLILASRAILGIAVAVIVTCSGTLIGDYHVGATRTRTLGLQTMFATISAMVFFFAGGMLGSVSWRGPFWAYSASLILLPFIISAELRLHSGYARSAPADTDVYRDVRWRDLFAKCLITLMGSVIFHVPVVETSRLFSETDGRSTTFLGMLTALTSVATVIGGIAFYEVHSADPRRLLAVGFGFAAVGFAAVGGSAHLTVAAGGAVVVLGLMVSCVGCGLLLPTMVTGTVRHLRFKQRGRGTGLWNGAFYLGQFACPVAMLAISERVGGQLSTFGAVAVVCVILAAAIRLVPRAW